MTRRTDRTDDDDDENLFDERGVLRDHARWRVPMYLMDSVQRAIAMDGAQLRADRPLIVDAAGGTAGLNRPGYRFPTGDARQRANDARNEALAEYQQHQENAWRSPARDDAGSGYLLRVPDRASSDGPLVSISAAFQHSAVSTASAGRKTSRLGIALSAASCSTGWWVGPSSPRPMESWVIT